MQRTGKKMERGCRIICEKLMLDNGTVSPLLKKMEHAGYIDRARSSEDDRVVRVTLTQRGRDLQEEARDVPFKVGSCVALSPQSARMLYDLLYELLGKKGESKDGNSI